MGMRISLVVGSTTSAVAPVRRDARARERMNMVVSLSK
jgi:hypothetical protein